jgi:hypothetical protein
MAYFSILKKEAVQASEISTNLYRSTWRHIPERGVLFLATAVGTSNPTNSVFSSTNRLSKILSEETGVMRTS